VDKKTEQRVPRLLGQARTLLQQGRLLQAEGMLRQILEVEPSHFDALHLLGVASAQQGKMDEAQALFVRALDRNPGSALAHANLGQLFREKGRYEESLECYDRALAIRPDDPTTLAKRGSVLQALNRNVEALESYERAIKLNPKYVEALNNLGNVLAALERYDEALANFDRVLAINPRIAETLNNRGSALQALGKLDEALVSYEKALVIKPDYVEAWNSKANILRQLGRHIEARASYERAIASGPDTPAALNLHGVALKELNRHEDAIAQFDRALAIDPRHVQALYNRGNAFMGLYRFDEAISSYDQALAIQPRYAEAWNNRGAALQCLNRHTEGITSYERALAIKPDDGGLHFNLSLALLTVGNFGRGWREYEWRWKSKDFTSRDRGFRQPLWTGKESLTNKTILLYPEQGFGDFIQFVRYAPAVTQLGARVLLEVPGALRRLLEGFSGVEQVITKGETLPEFDLHCPVMSLPLAFGTTLESIPAEVPYLFVPPSIIEKWRQKLGEATRPRVGIVWSGSPTQKNDHNRSIPLSTIYGLAGTGVELFSIQKEVREEEQLMLSQFKEIRHFGGELRDFADTAALLSLMDLVISVCTSVAHLSGALGKPTWIPLAFRPDWRWLLDREDSPWYPTARLFRQPALRDWESVVRRITEEIRKRFALGDAPKKYADSSGRSQQN
jgi:tetratricopeptide (TPR) repeat protein